MGEKIYNTKTLSKIIKKKTNLKNFEICLFFSEFGHSSGWVDFLKKEGLVKTVHYPSNAQIYLGKKKLEKKLSWTHQLQIPKQMLEPISLNFASEGVSRVPPPCCCF